MNIFTLLVVGLITGLLGGLFVGGAGYRLSRDIGIGGAGAVLGSWVFGALGVTPPFGGIGGTSFVAVMGAAVLLVVLRVFRNAQRTRDLWTRSPSSSTPWRP